MISTGLDTYLNGVIIITKKEGVLGIPHYFPKVVHQITGIRWVRICKHQQSISYCSATQKLSKMN